MIDWRKGWIQIKDLSFLKTAVRISMVYDHVYQPLIWIIA